MGERLLFGKVPFRFASFRFANYRKPLRIVNAVVTLIAGSSDRLTEICFLQTKATHFERMITTVDEVNSDKTKVREEFISRSVCLIVLLPNSMSKLIHN